ncbi:MAG: hypothetical protein P8177_11865 [Gemmatimonadota bacterium]
MATIRRGSRSGGAGHFTPEDRPAAVAGAIDEVLVAAGREPPDRGTERA